jgi:16S rRNA (guanine527-N7)-methyltransferase
LNKIISKHFIDSLSIVKVIMPKSQKDLDVGTGAGFPGIPIKIVFPEIELVLLDSLKKRLNFLDEVIQELDLKKVKTIHGRAEDYGRDAGYREQFDLCVSRAVAKLSTLSEYCLPYVKKQGCFVSYKSGRMEEELTQSGRAIKILGARVDQVENFVLPGTDMERSLIVLKKEFQTPKDYPRSAGKPDKDPL